MSAAQLLLRRLLEQAGGAAETGYLLVIDGEGLQELPDQIPTPRGSYAVHRVGTELGLRHLLWRARGAPLIAVLPEGLALRIQKAPDLLRRARNQRVHALSVNDVLEVVLGVRVIGAEAPWLQQLALEHLGQLGVALAQRTLPTVIDRRLLAELLVDVCVGEEVRTRRPAELLAGWLLDPPAWADDPNVNQLVRDALPTLHGDEGRLLAWALGEPGERLRALVRHGAVLTVDGEELPKPAWGPLYKAAAEAPVALDRRLLRPIVARLAEDTLAALGDGAAPLLAEADRLGREALTPTQLQTSRVLPLAFADRCHTLAKKAADGGAISALDLTWVRAHRAAQVQRAELAVIEALARLTRWLEQPAAAPADLLDQLDGYRRDGAFADWAMTQLRRALAGSALYHAEAGAVLAAARARRDRDNRRFAETLAQGYEACLHRPGLTPLHRLWKRTVAPVWEEEPAARLLLVVLDGCSYAVFLELLHALAQDSAFPIGIRPDAEGRVMGLRALAPLPSITSHARGALFLGELPSDPLVAETVFRDQDEARTDKARFQQNAGLGGRPRRLFLKSDLADGGQALLQAIADDDVAVVAAVFNAVDDQIGSANTGATVRLRPEDIAGLKPALRAALTAQRRVLVTADHGHSPFVDKSLRVGAGGPGKAARFVALGPGEAAPEGFLELDLGGLGGPPERRAFAWRTGVYHGSPQVGFHGGCALEELFVPLAWLAREGLHADEPGWWYGEGAVVAPVEAKAPAPPFVTPLPSDDWQAPAKKKAGAGAAAQASLFDPADRVGGLRLPEAVLARLTAEQKAVLVLLKETGHARAKELAARLDKNPGRLNGLMRALRRALHEDGYVLFTDEVLPDGETLYRYQPVGPGGPGGGPTTDRSPGGSGSPCP